MPDIIIIAGPNGAGKTTFAKQFIAVERPDLSFVNADEFSKKLAAPPDGAVGRDAFAGRLMLRQIDDFVASGQSFMFETTLASRIYARKIPLWRKTHRVALVYLRLPDVESAIYRVAQRVAAGGHDIPTDVIRRRFDKSRDYFDNLYQSIVDEWQLWYLVDGRFDLTDAARKSP